MKKLIISLFSGLLALAASGQVTPSQAMSQAASYQALSDHDLLMVQDAMLSILAFGAVVTPTAAMTNAAAYTALDSKSLQAISASVLANMAGIGSPTNGNFLIGNGNIRIGTNVTSFAQATNAIFIGSPFTGGSEVVYGNGIYIGGGNGGGAYNTCISIGSGAGSGANLLGNDFDIAIGYQTDASGLRNIIIGDQYAGVPGDYVISVGGFNQGNGNTNVITLGQNWQNGVPNNNMTVIGNMDITGSTPTTTKTWILGTIVGNGNNLTNLQNSAFPTSASLAISSLSVSNNGTAIGSGLTNIFEVKNTNSAALAPAFSVQTNGNVSIGSASGLFLGGQNTAAFTVVNTNFIQGFIYSNFYGAPISITVGVQGTAAAVAGAIMMDIQAPAGTFVARTGKQTQSSTAANTNAFNMSWVIGANQTYTVTNTLTAGAGNSVVVSYGQITVY